MDGNITIISELQRKKGFLRGMDSEPLGV